MTHATIPLNGTTLPRLTLRFALTFSSITTFMYESAWKNVSNTGAIFHHAPTEQVAGFGFDDGLPTVFEFVNELDGHGASLSSRFFQRPCHSPGYGSIAQEHEAALIPVPTPSSTHF